MKFFCAQLCAKIAIKKHIRFSKKFVKLCQKLEKVPVLQAPRSKVKILRRFKKILRGHASGCPCVLEALSATTPNHGGSHQALTKTEMKEHNNTKVVTQRPWPNKGWGCNWISPTDDLLTTETEARTLAKANF